MIWIYLREDKILPCIEKDDLRANLRVTVKERGAFQRVTIMSISGEKVNWRKLPPQTITMILINLRWHKIVPYIEKEGEPGANLRVTFHWENCSIDSAWCRSVLIETMLAYAIHNFEYQHIKITMMETRAFARVNWKKWAISTYVKIIEIREVGPCIPCILNGIQVIRIVKDQGVHCIKTPWSLLRVTIHWEKLLHW